MRYYKLNNQYYSYNELHNTFGYTYTPTWSVTYLLVSPWGDNTQTINGYSEPTNVYSESSYFVENSIGWFTLNQLSINEGYFPSNVESTTLVRNGETSNVVFLSFADEPRYLIEKDLSVGWLTEQEYTERGWGKGTGIILIDIMKGQVVHYLTFFVFMEENIATRKTNGFSAVCRCEKE